MFSLHFINILLIAFLDYFGIAVVFPVFAGMLFDTAYPLLDINTSTAVRGALLGILVALTPLAQFFCAPLLGAYSDMKGRKSALLFGTGLGCFAYALAIAGIALSSLWILCLSRVLTGISTSTMPVAQAMIVDISTKEEKTRRFSLFSASAGIGFTIGPFMGGVLADPSLGAFGYSKPFMVACALSLLSFLVVYFKFSETCAVTKKAHFNVMSNMQKVGKVFLWPNLKWLFVATFVFSFGWSFFNEFIPLLLMSKFKFDLQHVGYYYAYGGAWYAFNSGVMVATVLKYVQSEEILMKAFVGSSLAMLCFYIFGSTTFIWTSTPLLTFCIALIFPTLTSMVSNRANPENQGEVLGVYQSICSFAMGLSPLLVGPFIGMFPEFSAIGGALSMLLACAAFRNSFVGVRVRP